MRQIGKGKNAGLIFEANRGRNLFIWLEDYVKGGVDMNDFTHAIQHLYKP